METAEHKQNACLSLSLTESPRWLLEAGRSEEARGVLLKIAEANGVQLGSDFDRNFARLNETAKRDRERREGERRRRRPLHDVFKNMAAVPEFRRRALVGAGVQPKLRE